jgi:hypothetical protein
MTRMLGFFCCADAAAAHANKAIIAITFAALQVTAGTARGKQCFRRA